MHKPTWNAAVGRSGGNGMEGGFSGPKSHHHSVRAIPSQTRMKQRSVAADGNAKAAMASRLAAREVQHHLARGDLRGADAARRTLALPAPAAPALADTRGLAASVDKDALSAGLTAEEAAMLSGVAAMDADVEVGAGDGASRAAKRPRAEAGGSGGGGGEWSDEDDSSDDEDEEAALMAELAHVRQEREAEAAAARAEEEARAAADTEASAARGNPLLDLTGSAAAGAVRRRWDEDVVFRNQASTAPRPGKRYVNDTIRNDFHKRFMRRYVQ